MRRRAVDGSEGDEHDPLMPSARSADADVEAAREPAPATPSRLRAGSAAFTVVFRQGSGLGLVDADGVRLTSPAAPGDARAAAEATAAADAFTSAVADAVGEAVHDVLEQKKRRYDYQANVHTLVAVTGVVLFWRGLWNCWDLAFGLSWASNIGSLALGLAIMVGIRICGVRLAASLPGG